VSEPEATQPAHGGAILVVARREADGVLELDPKGLHFQPGVGDCEQRTEKVMGDG